MSSSKLKTLACSLSVISGLMLAGCSEKTAETTAATNVPATAASPSATPTSTPPPAPAETFEKLGLFSGKFEPNDEYNTAKAEFEKWAESHGEEGNYDIKAVPEHLRRFLYREPIYGYYLFISPNRLSIVIDDIRDDKTFTAHSVAAGNQRAITGTWEQIDTGLHMTGNEPGDEPNDGSFDMTLTAQGLNGTWTPKTGSAMPKAFTLVRTKFEYDPKVAQRASEKEDYIDLGVADFDKNPSIDKLKSKDVENLTQPHIRIIRNLIFARHGYSFKGKDLRLTFEGYNWYLPVSNDVKDQLTDIEKANIALLNRYEKYADKHYDEFGR